jgi:hypothetical protein
MTADELTALGDLVVLGVVAVGWVLGIWTFVRDDCPSVRQEHRKRQRSRVSYGGWTLPWWMCGLWWFGWERLAPKPLRVRTPEGEQR